MTSHEMDVFIHVPKTGGVTLRTVMRAVYPDLFVTGGPLNPAPPSDDPRWRTCSAAAGHFGTGIAELVGRTGRYVTLVREPVAHVISHYHHRVRKGRFEGTLDEFVERTSNAQTRWLASPFDGPRTPVLEEDGALEGALAAIEGFHAVGTTERFEDTVAVIAHRLGWPAIPPIVRQNENPVRDAAAEVPAALLAEIRERNSLDAELHRVASERLEHDLRSLPAPSAARRSWRTLLRRAPV